MGLRIGILSDTHLGVYPLDTELGEDPFESFEESLKILVGNGADIIIHAGDFYDRKDPAPWVRDRAIDILRSTITGKRSEISVLEGDVNFNAEDVNIAVPLFLIHGTHDRPVGMPIPAPPFQDIVAAGFVNYIDANPNNRFSTKKVVVQKDKVKLSISGIGHQTEGFINQSIAEYGLEPTKGAVNICMLHNKIEGIISGEGECIDLSPFAGMDYVVSGHAHIPRMDGKGTLEAIERKDLKSGKLLVPGATVATDIYPQQEGIKYAHMLELGGSKPVLKSFELESSRRVFCKSIRVDRLTREEIRGRIITFLDSLPFESMKKKPRVRVDLSGTLGEGVSREVLGLEEIEGRFKDKVQNWTDMIVPRDLYSEDELRHLEELRSLVQAGDALPAALTHFGRKLKQLGYKPEYFNPDELFETFSRVKSTQTARKKVADKLEEALK